MIKLNFIVLIFARSRNKVGDVAISEPEVYVSGQSLHSMKELKNSSAWLVKITLPHQSLTRGKLLWK